MPHRSEPAPCIATLAIAVLLLGGCDVPEPCPEGFLLERDVYACLPIEGDAGPMNDAGLGDGGACEPVAYGEPCLEHEDCGCPADFCARVPGTAMGFCTTIRCLEGGPCPDGWRCLDISIAAPEQGSICIEE
jgi:hypothetical protein